MILQLIWYNNMAEEDGQEVRVEPDDPEFQLEEHIAFKRRQEALNAQLRKLCQENLSEFLPTMDGSAFAFTRLSLPNKGLPALTELIGEYPHLRSIDLSSNQLTDTLHLQKLRFASQLNLTRNLIADGRFLSNAGIFPLLKSLSLANNKLNSLPALLLGNLIQINLNGNLIVSLEDFDGHAKLEVLELRGNKISNLKGLGKAPQLRELYLADNNLTTLHGLGGFPKLEKLHIRKNKIANISAMPALPSLRYVNLRENTISKLADVSGIASSASVLNLLANPVSEQMGDNTKKEVWMKYRQYQRVNKTDITAQEKEEFDKEYKERVAEQERQAKEQAEREAAQKEAAEKGQA